MASVVRRPSLRMRQLQRAPGPAPADRPSRSRCNLSTQTQHPPSGTPHEIAIRPSKSTQRPPCAWDGSARRFDLVPDGRAPAGHRRWSGVKVHAAAITRARRRSAGPAAVSEPRCVAGCSSARKPVAPRLRRRWRGRFARQRASSSRATAWSWRVIPNAIINNIPTTATVPAGRSPGDAVSDQTRPGDPGGATGSHRPRRRLHGRPPHAQSARPHHHRWKTRSEFAAPAQEPHHQREIGIDTDGGWEIVPAKTNAAPGPDVIPMEAKSRHVSGASLCSSRNWPTCQATPHANKAANTAPLDRIINFFPRRAPSQLLMDPLAQSCARWCPSVRCRQVGKAVPGVASRSDWNFAADRHLLAVR